MEPITESRLKELATELMTEEEAKIYVRFMKLRFPT
jgi:hypothetical protein